MHKTPAIEFNNGFKIAVQPRITPIQYSAASNTLRFTTNGISLFLFTIESNFRTRHIFVIACSFIDDDTQPSLVKSEPRYYM